VRYFEKKLHLRFFGQYIEKDHIQMTGKILEVKEHCPLHNSPKKLADAHFLPILPNIDPHQLHGLNYLTLLL